jgi:hypothetical protein
MKSPAVMKRKIRVAVFLPDSHPQQFLIPAQPSVWITDGPRNATQREGGAEQNQEHPHYLTSPADATNPAKNHPRRQRRSVRSVKLSFQASEPGGFLLPGFTALSILALKCFYIEPSSTISDNNTRPQCSRSKPHAACLKNS